jgi:methionyl-tRNA formyltransferase
VENYDVVRRAMEEEGDSVQTFQSETDLEKFKSNNIDFIVSYGYKHLIKGELLAAYQGNIINLHPSFLPYGRGYFPNFWSHVFDFPKGVKIHSINNWIDTGAILAQCEHFFNDEDTLRTSYYTLQTSMLSLFENSWNKIRTKKLTPMEQDQSSGNLFYKRQFDHVFSLLPNGFDTSIGELKLLREEIIKRYSQLT